VASTGYRDGVTTTPPAIGPTRRRRGVLAHPWRWGIVALVLVVVLNLVVIALAESDTSPGGRTLPSAIDSLTPPPGELIRPQDTIGADLRDDLTGVLVLDGAEIPEDQLERVVPLAQVTFRPGPDKDLESFSPGEHTLVVRYWPQGKRRPAHPASYSWRFRVGA
jgi:hypothetical protein